MPSTPELEECMGSDYLLGMNSNCSIAIHEKNMISIELCTVALLHIPQVNLHKITGSENVSGAQNLQEQP